MKFRPYINEVALKGLRMNRSEIWSDIKRELLSLKWVGNTNRQLNPLKESPRLVRDWCPSNFNFPNAWPTRNPAIGSWLRVPL